MALRAGHPPTHLELAGANAAIVVIFTLAGLWVWRRRSGNLNPSYFAAGGATLAVITWCWLAIAPPLHVGIAFAHLVFAANIFSLGMFLEKRLLLAALVGFAGAPLAYLLPMFCFETNVFATMGSLVVLIEALRGRETSKTVMS